MALVNSSFDFGQKLLYLSKFMEISVWLLFLWYCMKRQQLMRIDNGLSCISVVCGKSGELVL